MLLTSLNEQNQDFKFFYTNFKYREYIKINKFEVLFCNKIFLVKISIIKQMTPKIKILKVIEYLKITKQTKWSFGSSPYKIRNIIFYT